MNPVMGFCILFFVAWLAFHFMANTTSMEDIDNGIDLEVAKVRDRFYIFMAVTCLNALPFIGYILIDWS